MACSLAGALSLVCAAAWADIVVVVGVHSPVNSLTKEQVADMLQRMLRFPKEDMPTFMDATDGLAAAYCHYLQMGRPAVEKGYHGWKDFIAKNPDKVKK